MNNKKVSDFITVNLTPSPQQALLVAETKANKNGEWVSPLHLLLGLMAVPIGDGDDRTFRPVYQSRKVD